MTGDAELLALWWREVLASGRLPAGVQPVQGRLLRQVGRGALPSGEVFLKVMAFPRGKDRLRYLLRLLPAAHEAAMLRRVAAAGLCCPAVVAVHTARRFLLPYRSMLVTRALPVAAAPPSLEPTAVLALRADAALRLLAAGLFHPDLNPDNFVWLQDGRLAVLDLQSMRRCRHRARAALRMGARLLLEAVAVPVADAAARLEAAGFGRAEALRREAARQGLRFLRSRVRRCLGTSTGFQRRRHGPWVEYGIRGDLPAGSWQRCGPELRRAWLGQRLLQMFERRPPLLPRIRHNSLWFPGNWSAYIPDSVAERARDELRDLMAGYVRHAWIWQHHAVVDLTMLRQARARYLEEGGG